MKINDILNEASDDSGDYQQMLAFTRANRVGGVPDDQQIPLALFKELKKQQQQNQALGAELDAAEQRIDQATQSGELSQRELGMHRAELDRERAAGDEQKAAVGQLGQQYAERERASTEQVQDLAQRLATVKNMPGVNQDSVDKLEKQIQDLSKTGIGADKVQELERSIAAIQQAESTDDAAIKDLIQQVKDAQAATQELEKTKAGVGKDLEAQLSHFKEVEQTVNNLRDEINRLNNDYYETDAAVLDLENEVSTLKTERDAALAAKKEMIRLAKEKAAADAAAKAAAPTPQPATTQPQWTPAARATAQKLIDKGILQPEPVAESAFKRSIAWATGKTK